MNFRPIVNIKWSLFKEARYKIDRLTPETCRFGKGIYAEVDFNKIFIEDDQEIVYDGKIHDGVLYEEIRTDDFNIRSNISISEEQIKELQENVFPIFGVKYHGFIPSASLSEETLDKLTKIIRDAIKKKGTTLLGYPNFNFPNEIQFSRQHNRIDQEITLVCNGKWFYLVDAPRQFDYKRLLHKGINPEREKAIKILTDILEANKVRLLV